MAPSHKVGLRIRGTPKECDEERIHKKNEMFEPEDQEKNHLKMQMEAFQAEGVAQAKEQIQDSTNLGKVRSMLNQDVGETRL